MVMIPRNPYGVPTEIDLIFSSCKTGYDKSRNKTV